MITGLLRITIATVLLLVIGILVIWKGVRDKTRRISYMRIFVQITFTFLIFLGVLIGPSGSPHLPWVDGTAHDMVIGESVFGVDMPDGLPVPVLAGYYPCGRTVTCAIWQIQSYIYPFWNAGHGWGVTYMVSGLVRLGVVFGVVILMSVVLGRSLCGWVCPFGLYMDLLTRLRRTLKIRHWSLSERVNEGLRQSRYLIIAAFLILSFVFGAEAIVGTQLIAGTEPGGFIYTYFSQPFCQVCPVRPLSVSIDIVLGVMRPEWVFPQTAGMFYELGLYITSINVTILILVTVLSFAYRRLWCRICPLGGLIALFNRFIPFRWASVIRLDKVEEKCTSCGICKRVCPTQVTEVYEKNKGDVTASDCILCLRCVEMCPHEGCLRVMVADKPLIKSRNWLES